MATKKKPGEKLTIQEYQDLQARNAKQRFKIQFYPWPVMVALLLPLGMLIFLVIYYTLHIQGYTG